MVSFDCSSSPLFVLQMSTLFTNEWCYRYVDVQMVKGFANVVAGGEGLFMTTLKGPGSVWLQGQPPQRLISEIARRVPAGGGLGLMMGGGGSGSGGDEGSSEHGEDSEQK